MPVWYDRSAIYLLAVAITNTKRLENRGAGVTSEVSDGISLIEPYRRELYLHCYRLLGSLHDAEDMVQETMLRAWRHFDTFKGSASLRTWLYTIATNTCLDALKKRGSRTLPARFSPASDPMSPVAP